MKILNEMDGYSDYCSQSLLSPQQVLFTVEQIELIRRLRNSGITKDQIVLAFDSLDRLDRELGPVYTIPISQVQYYA